MSRKPALRVHRTHRVRFAFVFRCRFMRSTLIALVAGLALAPRAGAADDPGIAFFETKVRPVLADKCFKCHGPDKQKGGLRLDSAEAVKKGGDSGTPLFVVGKPD